MREDTSARAAAANDGEPDDEPDDEDGTRTERTTGLRRRRDRALGQPIEPTLFSVARIAGELGHELNNQLAAVLNYTYVLDRRLEHDADAAQHLAELREAAWNASGLAEHLLTFSHAQRVPPIGTQLQTIVRELEPLLMHGLDPDRELVIDVADDLHPVRVARGPVESLLLRAALIKHRSGSALGPLVIAASNARLDVEAADGVTRCMDFVRLDVGPLPIETGDRRVVSHGTSNSTEQQLLSDRVRTGLSELGAKLEVVPGDRTLRVAAWLPRARA